MGEDPALLSYLSKVDLFVCPVCHRSCPIDDLEFRPETDEVLCDICNAWVPAYPEGGVYEGDY